ncbi:unnamed protein product, partial [Amoebophrya sp. A25]
NLFDDDDAQKADTSSMLGGGASTSTATSEGLGVGGVQAQVGADPTVDPTRRILGTVSSRGDIRLEEQKAQAEKDAVELLWRELGLKPSEVFGNQATDTAKQERLLGKFLVAGSGVSNLAGATTSANLKNPSAQAAGRLGKTSSSTQSRTLSRSRSLDFAS